TRVVQRLSPVTAVTLPDAAFYLWLRVHGDDTAFARDLLAQYNVTVLPGSLLARDAHGSNPGRGHVRIALVAPTDECDEAADRLVRFISRHS
ncbi:MAG: aminotransferase class I/II-fold pyridoxal phosphate-dependent enzyme, partial [Burkholderiales bacterium]|nr:aminotransferase class I/II-fold pyridoxal phosphate-dependent enzyme [Burkholderiales bacterium]